MRDVRQPNRNALKCCMFPMCNLKHVFESAQTSVELQEADRLLHWLHTCWTDPVVSLVEIYQRGPRDFRDKTDALEAVAVLEDHGWLVRLDGVHEVAGVRRRDVWRIVKA